MNIHVLDRPGLADIPGLLRSIADSVETGKFGDVGSCALVLDGDNLEVFGLGGPANSHTTHYLLALGQRKLE